MAHWLERKLHPEWYHGVGARPPFFEGWYFKLVDPTRRHRLAVIPGIFLDPAGRDSHSFVQVLDGATASARFHRYPADAFDAAPGRFDVSVGPNHFSLEGLKLDLGGPEGSLSGTVHLDAALPWPVSLASPGAMGWYSWLPFLETYHGILSLDHGLAGALTMDGRPLDFTGGRGYLEKDWGRTFPSAWVWMQSNHFSQPGVSLTASVALVPRVGRTFRGFIIGLLHQGRLHRFATYLGSRLERLEILDDGANLTLRGGGLRLEIEARGGRVALLHGPSEHDFRPRVEETLDATIAVRLTETTSGRPLFQGTGEVAGLEIQGDLERLKRGR